VCRRRYGRTPHHPCACGDVHHALVALTWSLLQLWIASPCPSAGFPAFSTIPQARGPSILAFALFLAFLLPIRGHARGLFRPGWRLPLPVISVGPVILWQAARAIRFLVDTACRRHPDRRHSSGIATTESTPLGMGAGDRGRGHSAVCFVYYGTEIGRRRRFAPITQRLRDGGGRNYCVCSNDARRAHLAPTLMIVASVFLNSTLSLAR